MRKRSNLDEFERLFLPHMDAAYNLARWITVNDQDAEDVVQEAYLRAFKAFATYSDDNRLGWILTIVRNTGYSWLNKHSSAKQNVIAFDEAIHSLEDTSVGGARVGHPAPDAIAAGDSDYERVHAALEKLPLVFREVIVLREFEGLSYKEIADIVAVPLGTVMSRLARGRAHLRQWLVTTTDEETQREL